MVFGSVRKITDKHFAWEICPIPMRTVTEEACKVTSEFPVYFHGSKWIIQFTPGSRFDLFCALKKFVNRDTKPYSYKYRMKIEKYSAKDEGSFDPEFEMWDSGVTISTFHGTFDSKYCYVSGNHFFRISENLNWFQQLFGFPGYAFSLYFFNDELEKENISSVEKECDKNFHEDLEKLSESMRKILKNPSYSDVALIIKDVEFTSHKEILSARSPVFQKMFESNMSEKNCGKVLITDCDPGAFEDFLLYLYSGKIEISKSNAANLHYISDKYGVDDLFQKCLEFMKENLSVDSFCDFVMIVLTHLELSFLEKAIQFFSENFKQVIESEEWKAFIKSKPSEANELLIKAAGKLNV